jgi:hypothetical protein
MYEPHIAAQLHYKGYNIKAVHTYDPENPRTACNNLSIMTCFHPRYNLGDYHENPYVHSQFSGWGDVESTIRKDGGICIMPLTLYDHSGLTIYLTEEPHLVQYPQWDSMRVGFIYTTKEKVEEWLGWKRITKSRKEKLIKRLKDSLSMYDAYLRGDVYDLVIEDPDGEEVEHLGEWYGLDNIEKYFDECKSLIDMYSEEVVNA